MKGRCVKSRRLPRNGGRSEKHAVRRQRRRNSTIPAEVERCLKAVNAPSLFTQENQEACEAVHKHIRQAVEQGTETMTIPVGADLLAKVEEVLKGYGWTVEESAVLFFMWCVVCPERAKAWLTQCMDGEAQ